MRVVVGLACAWGLGILAEGALRLPAPAWLACLGAGALGVIIAARHRRSLVAAVLGAALAGGATASAWQRARPGRIEMAGATDDDVFEGVIESPVEEEADRRTYLVDLAWRFRDGEALPVALRARVGEARDGQTMRAPLLPGDVVRFLGRARDPGGFADDGAFDQRRFLVGRGIDVVARASPPGLVRVDAAPHASAWRWPARAGERAARRIARAAPGEGGALLAALVLGRRDGLSPALGDAFRRAGVSHVLSVSGLHLAAVTLLVFLAARRSWLSSARLAARIPAERMAALVALPVAGFYTLVTGAEVATVRSFLCALLVFGGMILGRTPDAITSLAAAAVAILAVTPWALFEPSFQLSFSAAAALATLAVRWTRALSAGRSRGPASWSLRLVIASTAATLATAPWTALHFGVLQPAGILANLLVVPAAELLVLPCGLAGTLVGALFPSLGSPVLRIAAWLAALLARAVTLLASVSPVIDVSPPNALELVALVLGLVAAAIVPPRRRAALIVAAALAIAGASYATSTFLVPLLRRDVRITFLDVGQGDASVVEAPGGETWLIDAGGRLFGDDDGASVDPGERAVWPFLRAHRVRRLQLVILSHPHPDHYAGLAAVAAHLPIDELWVAGGIPDDGPFGEELRTLAARGTRIRHPPLGAVHRAGPAQLVVLAPNPGPDGGVAADPRLGANDNSLVVRLDIAGRSVLFPGDVETRGEARLLAAHDAPELAADVVKVPHHGSPSSSTPAFVARTSPRVAVISCGRWNRFGFPASDVVTRWQAGGAKVFRIDTVGAVTVAIDPGGRLAVAVHGR